MSHDEVYARSPEEGAEPRGGHDADPAASSADTAEASTDDSQRHSPERRAEGEDSQQPVGEVAAVEELLEGEIDDDRVARLTATRHEAWEGPLPPPVALAAYERILPGAADRVLAMAERNLGIREAHGHTVRASVDGQIRVETITAEADRDALKRGQYLATGVSALVAILSVAGMFLTPWAAVGFAVPLSQVAAALVRTVSDGVRSKRSDEEQSASNSERPRDDRGDLTNL